MKEERNNEIIECNQVMQNNNEKIKKRFYRKNEVVW